MMKSFLAIFWLIIGSAFSGQVFAQQNCPAVNTVKKWEVISSMKLLAYDNNDQYYFFMNIGFITGNSPKVGGPITLRFFSSTICTNDTVIVNGSQTFVMSLEGIRR
jgi:hypothetical protein